MNSGKAVSVHEEAEPQMVMTMLSPTGRLVNSAMPIHATPASDKPIQTPLPRMAKSRKIRKPVTKSSMMCRPLFRSCQFAVTRVFADFATGQ